MKITVDTNVLVRASVRDDADQAKVADNILKTARLVAIPIIVLCEYVWVLNRFYGLDNTEIETAIRILINSKNVVCDMPSVEAGLDMMAQGGDFADGAIAYTGQSLGGAEFVSFDEKAVNTLRHMDMKARLLQA